MPKASEICAYSTENSSWISRFSIQSTLANCEIKVASLFVNRIATQNNINCLLKCSKVT